MNAVEKYIHDEHELTMQEFEDATRQAIDEAGGCSICGDLSGFECICDDSEDDEPTQICEVCLNTLPLLYFNHPARCVSCDSE